MIVILAFGALLFSGAQALVMRRQLQNAGDSGALAAANLLVGTGGCSTGAGNPDPALVAAARAAVALNIPGFDPNAVAVSCPGGFDNYAVAVDLRSTTRSYFGTGSIAESTTSTAYNGPRDIGKFSVMMLDECHNGTSSCLPGTWAASRNGCPSIGFNGGPTIRFEGSVQANSRCLFDPLGYTGAVGTSGSGNADITLLNTVENGQAVMRMVGTYNPSGFRNLTGPRPLTIQPKVKDPYSGLVAPSTAGWLTCPSADTRCPSNGGAKTQIKNGCFVLSPGIYNGGIEIATSGKAYLLPGLYDLKGGGLNFSGNGNALYTIKSGTTPGSSACASLTPEGGSPAGSTWETTLCPPAVGNAPASACGVMIYNECNVAARRTDCSSSGGNPAFGPIDVTGGGAFRLRAFCASDQTPTAARCTDTKFAPAEQQASNPSPKLDQYRNIVIWQAGGPTPSSSYAQPGLNLRGNGSAFIAGTVYAPSAQVSLGGNCGGTGGTLVDLTLQFVSYDLLISGSCTYTFIYRANQFATTTTYGLVR